METNKPIEVAPYNPEWPEIFETEATIIREALGDNCLEVHHIGSTAVPGLAAKPKIDIIAVVKNGKTTIELLEKAGFNYKGEWNIPFKYGFTKRERYKINLHVLEESHPEIEVNIIFRDHLRNNPSSVIEYSKIKISLLSNEESSKKSGLFSGYTLGKDKFIRKVLEKEVYNGHRFLKVSHFHEWENYHLIQKKQIFDPINVMYDPNHPSITAEGHFHFVLYKGVKIVTAAHVEFLNDTEAALRSLATDAPYQNQGFGLIMMSLIEKWLKQQGKKAVKLHSRPGAESFYRQLGYEDCEFDDPCIQENYIDLGKLLYIVNSGAFGYRNEE
jgi:GrpB-like predicted nucleotidyltransferase (UPF0157 family)/GNAT superfamily N-acetyltransferase